MTLPLTPQASFALNLRGAGFMAVAMAGFACNDTLMKLIAPEIGLYQAILVRGIFATALVGLLVWRYGALRRMPPRRDLPWLAVRSAAEVAGALFYLTALFHMPIGNVSAIMQTTPLVLTMTGALFLGETVGWRRWAAILAGFAGVMLIVRPGGAGFDAHAYYAFASMLCVTVRDVATRKMSGETNSLLITLTTTVAVGGMGGVGAALGEWTPMETWHWVGMIAGAGLLFTGYFCGVVAVRTGEIGFTSPFRYTVLVWTMLAGLLVFDETPDGLTLVGAAVIVAAGLYAFWRERRLAMGAEAALIVDTAASVTQNAPQIDR